MKLGYDTSHGNNIFTAKKRFWMLVTSEDTSKAGTSIMGAWLVLEPLETKCWSCLHSSVRTNLWFEILETTNLVKSLSGRYPMMSPQKWQAS